MSQLTPTLWLSGINSAYSSLFLRITKITHILNCADDVSISRYPLELPLTIEHIPMEDDESPLFLSQLDEAVTILDTWQKKGHVVLVHCRAGISRSPSVIIAWLIRCKKMTFDEAWDTVIAARNFIRPNDFFMKILKEQKQKEGQSKDHIASLPL